MSSHGRWPSLSDGDGQRTRGRVGAYQTSAVGVRWFYYVVLYRVREVHEARSRSATRTLAPVSSEGCFVRSTMRGGGEIIVTGTPEEVAQCNHSHTGRFLRQQLDVV